MTSSISGNPLSVSQLALLRQQQLRDKLNHKGAERKDEFTTAASAEVFSSRLTLISKNLTTIPVDAFKAKNLKYVVLDENSLSGWPEGINQLVHLEVLSLNKNMLQEANLSGLTALRELYLSSNQLKEIPSMPHALAKLEILELQGNKIHHLSIELFTAMSGLKKLSIANNCVKELPQHIVNLSKLEHLDLSNNQLESLPLSLADMQWLKVLLLNDNQLKKILPQLGKLSKTELNLSNNPVDSTPVEIATSMLHHCKWDPVFLA